MLKITTVYKSIKRDIYLWYVDPIIFLKYPYLPKETLKITCIVISFYYRYISPQKVSRFFSPAGT